MTVQTKWICDGCGKERILDGRGTDWKHLTASITGLQGYPTCKDLRVEIEAHLCPSCATRYADNMNPRLWVRNDERHTDEAHP